MKSIFQLIDGFLSRCSKAAAAFAEKHRYCSIPILIELLKQKIDNSEMGKYDEMRIGEMIALAARIRNNRPISDPEKEYILAGS